MPLEVEIVDNRSVRASEVFGDCVLRLFDERYLLDLVPIQLRGNKVIIGMDWLIPKWGSNRLRVAISESQDPRWGRAGDPGQEATTWIDIMFSSEG